MDVLLVMASIDVMPTSATDWIYLFCNDINCPEIVNLYCVGKSCKELTVNCDLKASVKPLSRLLYGNQRVNICGFISFSST